MDNNINFPAFTAEQITAIVSATIKTLISNEVKKAVAECTERLNSYELHLAKLEAKVHSLGGVNEKIDSVSGDLHDFIEEVDVDSLKRRLDELESKSDIDLNEFDDFTDLKDKVESLEEKVDEFDDIKEKAESAEDSANEAHERTEKIPTLEERIENLERDTPFTAMDEMEKKIKAHDEFIFAFKTFAKECSSDI